MNEMIPPNHILRATHFTLYWAMVFCRNHTARTNANPRIGYEIMDSIHEVPNILDRWGTYDNDIDKLRTYFGCFDPYKWKIPDSPLEAPDLLQLFNRKANEFKK